MDIQTGCKVRMKKNHPCGADTWEVLRTGADFRIKCTGCGRQVMIRRDAFEKNIKEVLEQD